MTKQEWDSLTVDEKETTIQLIADVDRENCDTSEIYNMAAIDWVVDNIIEQIDDTNYVFDSKYGKDIRIWEV